MHGVYVNAVSTDLLVQTNMFACQTLCGGIRAVTPQSAVKP